MPVFIDQMNREVEIKTPPQKIISVVPSQTELLAYLGLDEKVIGITKFCVHPKYWLQQKTIVGGTKKLNLHIIEALKPDLIIGNKEENNQQEIELLMQKFPVWMSDINTVDDACIMIENIANYTQTEVKGNTLLNTIKQEFKQLPTNLSSKRAAYFIWNNPMMVAGEDTFINDILKRLGFLNVFEKNVQTAQSSYRYPQISEAELQTAMPDLILLSSEPFPFKEKHIKQFQNLCPLAQIIIVDGEMFSWYGSRLAIAPAYFKSLLYHHSL